MIETAMIDLKKFCGDGEATNRFQNNMVFFRGGHLCATDGRICVRVPAPEGSAETEGRFPDLKRLNWPGEDAAWQPWPAPDWEMGMVDHCGGCGGSGRLKGTPCPECNGDGEKEEKCRKCDGEGACHHCDAECEDCDGDGVKVSECPKCRGSGDIGDGTVCHYCNGKKDGPLPRYQRVSSEWVAFKYDAMIRGLPNVEFVMPTGEDVISFRFDGGQGLLAKITKDRSK